MPEARETWTDERLDDLSNRVDNGFARVDQRFAEVNDRIDQRFAEVNDRFNHLDTRIDGLQRTMIQFGATTTAGILATLVTILLTRS